MKWLGILITCLIAFLIAGLTTTYAAAESMPLQLLRVIQTQQLLSLTPKQIARYAQSGRSDYLGYTLAVAALQVTDNKHAMPEWPASRLLDKTLNELHRDLSFEIPADMRLGLSSEDLIFILAYAMVISDEAKTAIDILEQHLDSKSDYKQAVILQTLRFIGTKRANELLQARADKNNLISNLSTELYFPFWHEITERLHLIPVNERSREHLTRYASERCGERPALATYWLGFFPQAPNPQQQQGEINLLKELSRLPCYYNRYFAVRALALRSTESLEFWQQLYKTEKDPWLRGHIVRIAYAQHEQTFANKSLDWLATEPQQYVQWELMHGYLEAHVGVLLRDKSDIWLPVTLQFRLNFRPRATEKARDSFNKVLSWLEQGYRPQDSWVFNHLLYGIGKSVQGKETRRLLKIFSNVPDKNERWWIWGALHDTQALPMLRYWKQSSKTKELDDVIRHLEAASSQNEATCCHPSRACLLTWISDKSLITNEQEAQAWLHGKERSIVIQFTDELERTAEVTTTDGKQQWQHLYGCWRKFDNSQ